MLKLKNKAFTIIEVLIVLAIAGLILLIVFLAVPQLQRNSRNTGRKEDAGRLAAAINDYVSVTGSLPANTGANQTAWLTGTLCTGILNDAGTLNQYTNLSCVWSQASEANNTFVYTNPGGLALTATARTGNEAILVVGDQCSNTNPAQTVGASSNQGSLLYDLETASGNWSWACLNIQ